jgi:transcriptional regulator of acetoin/glycerol metabolism
MRFVYTNHKKAEDKYPHITKEFLQAERNAGKTVSQIAEETDIPRGTISSRLKTWGISGHKRGARL